MTQGLLFTAGLALALIGLGVTGFFGWRENRAKAQIRKPKIEEAVYNLDLANINLVDSWDLWVKNIRGTALDARRTPAYIIIREWADRMGMYKLVGAGIALVGTLLAASSWLFATKQQLK